MGSIPSIGLVERRVSSGGPARGRDLQGDLGAFRRSSGEARDVSPWCKRPLQRRATARGRCRQRARIARGQPTVLTARNGSQTSTPTLVRRDLESTFHDQHFGRRATIEQAKRILMARHSINADRAFEMLRDHSQHNGHKLVDIAQAIVDSHLLLPPSAPQRATLSSPPD
ncbi:MAG: ANTAR domain-containing protein [Gaiellaceae bacterium]